MTAGNAIARLETLRQRRGTDGDGGAVTTSILFDPACMPQPEPEWFEPGHWGRQAQPVSGSGRGGAWFVRASFGDAVLRHYLRGGMAARVSRDAYVWQGESRVRSFAEFRLTQILHAQGLPVARPLAAHFERNGMTYRAAIMVERLPHVRTFAELVDDRCSDAPWDEVGRLVARFHHAGLDHADLNANNVLFDTGGKGWLIDFDRGKLRRPGATWRENNLARLLRSLQKLRGERARSEVDRDFARLHDAYEAAWQASS